MENFNVKALKDMLENIFGVGSVHIYDGGKEISNKKTPCCCRFYWRKIQHSSMNLSNFTRIFVRRFIFIGGMVCFLSVEGVY